MIDIENKCIRCNSLNIERCKVNTRISLNGPETKVFGGISQKVYNPTDALICLDCGHIEFLCRIMEKRE